MITPFPPLSAETAHLVHFIFEWLGLLIGVQSYRILKKRYLANNPNIAKKIVGIRYSTGDLFVVPFCVGLIIGRIGCFLAGLNDGTFGVATSLSWGMDFGDGIARHPTQLYDMLWAVTMLIILKSLYPKLKKVSGLSFKLLFISYMLWRFAVDSIKPVPYEYWFGWSGIQWGCLIAMVLYLPFVLKDIKRLK